MPPEWLQHQCVLLIRNVVNVLMMLLKTVQGEQSLCSYCPNAKWQPVGFHGCLLEISTTAFSPLTVLLQTYKNMYNPVLYKLVL